MTFSQFMNETVTLRKKNGVTQSFRAIVEPKKVFTEDGNLPVEEGDEIERKLPNGMVETYSVLDRGFYPGMGGVIPNHYQMKVRKISETSARAQIRPGPTHIYNVTGANARVNVQSSDSSINVSSVTNEQLFTEIANTIGAGVQNKLQRSEMLDRLSALKAAEGKPSFGERYRDFIASAADHMTLLTPFLPALTALLVSATR